MRDRGRGVLLGQLIGDALGTTVEFSGPEDIARRFPDGLRDILGGGPFHLQPGQVTDDGELALALARTLVAHGWDLDARARAYAAWYASGPFDIGGTTRAAFGGWSDSVRASAMIDRAHERNGAPGQQANGALMRVSPLAIYGAFLDPGQLAERAREDARFSHPSAICQAANAAFVQAIQVGLHGGTPADAYRAALEVATDSKEVADALADVERQPECHGSQQGWVLIALRNAFHMLLHERSFEAALVRTVMAGGDADTNACIAGALLGSFCGLEGIPPRWVVRVLACRTGRGAPYQTSGAVVLADELLERHRSSAIPAAAADSSAEVAQAAESPRRRPRQPRGRERPLAAPIPSRPGVHTSDTDPIRVDWIPSQHTPGKVGITIAPGKHSTSLHSGGRWERDLDKDLAALATTWNCDVLVCLLEEHDLRRLKIPNLVERARARGLEVISFPTRDVSVPAEAGPVHELVMTLRERTREGKNVVLHCEGGLGRSGVIAGCYLATLGMGAHDILDALVKTRGSKCPETEEQRRFIRDFARKFGSAGSK
jgi:ADP-ribosylglycohydrolase/protein-tyrosine phosphatase